MTKIVKMEIVNSIQPASSPEGSLYFAESSKHWAILILLAKILQFLANTACHWNLAWPIGFGVYRANVYDSLLEIKISGLKCEQLVPAQPSVCGDDDDWAQMSATTITVSYTCS